MPLFSHVPALPAWGQLQLPPETAASTWPSVWLLPSNSSKADVMARACMACALGRGGEAAPGAIYLPGGCQVRTSGYQPTALHGI